MDRGDAVGCFRGSVARAVDAPGPDDPETIIGNLRIEPLELHLAYDALDLIDTNRGGDLLERVRALQLLCLQRVLPENLAKAFNRLHTILILILVIAVAWSFFSLLQGGSAASGQ